MKIMRLIVLVTVLSLTGCASYPIDSTKEEIWRARYEQNIILEEDDFGTTTWKATKHALWDIFTLFFAEIHYGRIRYNYGYYAAEARQRELKVIDQKNRAAQLQDDFKGKHYGEVLAAFGPPDRIQNDDMGGRMLIYEDSVDRLQTRFSVYVGPAHTESGGTYDSHTEQKIVWFYVADSVVRAAGIRNTTRSMVR